MSYLHVSYLLLSVYEPSRGGGASKGVSPLLKLREILGASVTSQNMLGNPLICHRSFMNVQFVLALNDVE